MRVIEKRVEMVPKETLCEVVTCDGCGNKAPTIPGKVLEEGPNVTRFIDGLAADLTQWFVLAPAEPNQSVRRIFCKACGEKRL